MSSPSKRIDVEKDTTMFGQLSNVEVILWLSFIEAGHYAQ